MVAQQFILNYNHILYKMFHRSLVIVKLAVQCKQHSYTGHHKCAHLLIFFLFYFFRSGLNVCGREASTLNSKSGSPGFKPRPSCCFLRQGTLLYFVSHWSLSTQPRWTSIPSRGEYQYSLACFMLRKPG